MAIKGGAPRPEPRAKRFWTPLTKGNGRSFDPTLSRARTSSGRKLRGRRRPRSVLRSSRERKCYSRECPNRRPRVIGGGEKIHIQLIPTIPGQAEQQRPSEEQLGSKAKKSWKSLYDERMASLRTEGLSSSYDYPEITHPDVNFTPCPRNDRSRKASSASPTRPISDGITMGASSTFDRLTTSMSKQKGGASSSTRLQPQLTSSSLGLTPPFGATGDISDMFAGVMNGLDELRRDMTKRIDQVDERAHQGRENLRDELTHVKSQARVDQAQLIRNTDQCLAESLAQANKESHGGMARTMREIERLLNDHDSTYAHTMTSLEKRLDAKSDLMMRKLDAILNGGNWEERSNPRERSRHANDGDGTGSYVQLENELRT